jgi:hypothetical protein
MIAEILWLSVTNGTSSSREILESKCSIGVEVLSVKSEALNSGGVVFG